MKNKNLGYKYTLEDKDRVMIALVILVIIMLVLFCIALSAYLKDHKKLENAGSVIAEKDAKISYYKAKSGRVVSSKSAAVVTHDQFAEYYPELKKTLSDLNIKVNNLNSIVRAGFLARSASYGKIDTVIVVKSDSLKWANRRAVVGNRFYTDSLYWNTSGTKITSRMTYQDSITMIFHVNKNGLFRRNTLAASASFNNPDAIVLNQTAVEVKEFKDKRFGVGVMVGYDPFHNSPGVLVGVSYDLFKF